MLTAMLPVMLEFKLEQHMAAQLSRSLTGKGPERAEGGRRRIRSIGRAMAMAGRGLAKDPVSGFLRHLVQGFGAHGLLSARQM